MTDLKTIDLLQALYPNQRRRLKLRVTGLTEAQLKDILTSSDPQWRIAERYGICQQSVSNIRLRAGKRSRPTRYKPKNEPASAQIQARTSAKPERGTDDHRSTSAETLPVLRSRPKNGRAAHVRLRGDR